MKEPAVVLKKNKEKAVRQRHHWIFSGAIKSLPDFNDGDILAVRTSQGEFLGRGYFSRRSSIIGRMLTFDDTPPLKALDERLDASLYLRRELIRETDAYRLVNAEGDGIPGLIVDRYDDVLVVQITTLGMERLKSTVLSLLIKKLFPVRFMKNRSCRPGAKKDCRISRGFSTENP